MTRVRQKILFISGLYHPNERGGAEKVVRALAEGMLEHDHLPVVVTTHDGAGDRVAQVNGLKVHYLGLKNIYGIDMHQSRPAFAKVLWHGVNRYNPLMARAAARVLDAERPDVVNTHNLLGFSCAVWNAVKSRRVPLVHTLHDYALMCPKTSMFAGGENCRGQCRLCSLYTSPAKRLSQSVGHVVGVSAFTLNRHLEAGYFRTASTQVIHNGIAARPLSELPGEKAEGPLRLGYVGHLLPQKGIRELVGAMSQWTPRECALTVAGTGAPEFEALLRAEAPANVRFLGFVDPSKVYGEIDVLVVPSLSNEALGLVVLEAYMHGVPVVVSRRGGLPETVEEFESGLTYDPLEPRGLRQAISVFVQDRTVLHRMRRGALKKGKYFQHGRMQAQYLELMAHAEAVPVKDQPRKSA